MAAAIEETTAGGSADARIPVTVLTGFLGSGKTTLLNHILTAKHGWRIAIIENEFGEVGIDDALLRKNVKEHTEEEVIEMLNGCVCCTVRDDLIVTLKKLVSNSSVMKPGGYKLDAVVIETTGMADPAPVAQTFFVDEEVQTYFKLDGIVTLVDAKHIEQHLDEEKPEGAENESVEQVAFADRIILNKIDLVPEESDLVRIEERLKSINSFAQIIRSTRSQVDAANVLNLGSFDLKRTLEMDPEFLDTEGEHEHDESVSSTGVNVPGEVDMSAFQDYMSTILREQGNDMFRMKGVLAVEGVPDKFVYQAVHMIFNSNFDEAWKEGEERCCRLTFIGKNIDKEALRNGFLECMATPENLQKRIKQLRFQLGDLVECNTGGPVWSKGSIVKHFYRGEDWPPGETAPYQIQLENGDLIYAPADDNRVIRAQAQG
eukprot:CAMPEP_0205910272 /NCGR_PEP_ID=MMETSP1325-20131115/4342_1 /ASSEMBLY_ACC=CAM_ASM_000708 /TAXON_ID=236786 /ORGANISM="Florenciella sp., Strain RCC1007" /LENGTH=430 /DNA_ID=CAMNT_0053276615 /DNA_START=73 /DNA_END=1365 /DNA_ORIENTATION=+